MFSYRFRTFALLVWAIFVSTKVPAQEGLREGLAALAQGSYDHAASLLAKFARDNPEHPAYDQALLGSGQALAKAGKENEAVHVFEKLLKRNAGTRLELPTRLVCAKCLLSLGRYSKATEHCRKVAEQSQGPNKTSAYAMMITSMCEDAQHAEALKTLKVASAKGSVPASLSRKLACFIGSHSLKRGQAAAAKDAYGWHLENHESTESGEAEIGYAWSEAALASDAATAGRILEKFADDHPQSSGTPRALLGASNKYLMADRNSDATRVLNRLAFDYPSSDEAPQALSALSDVATKLGDHKLAVKARTALTANHLRTESAMRVLHLAIADVVNTGDTQRYKKLAADFYATPSLIENATKTLNLVAQESGESAAVEFSRHLLAALADPNRHKSTAPIVGWLFKRGKWDLVAELAKPLPPEILVNNPSQGSQIAESLFRAGDRRAAYRIFDKLTQLPNAGFVNFVRRAELGVQIGDLEDAISNLQDARRAAGSKKDTQFVAIIEAQLSIRQAEFDSARRTLDSVVRSAASSTQLRGRAQWLIGETYFMQQEFATAIEAYRKCESLFPDSGWAPAALLQAGKAFEKLGQFPEAAVCYQSLLEKHGNSTHASLATARLAMFQRTKIR